MASTLNRTCAARGPLARGYVVLIICTFLIVDHASGQESGCSDSIAEIAGSAQHDGWSRGSLSEILLHRDRIPIPDPRSAPREEVCRFALVGAVQNHRDGRRAILAGLDGLLAAGRSGPDVQYGLATIRNQDGRPFAVLTDPLLTNSADPLVRFEVARALFLVGHADSALAELRTAVLSDPGAATLLVHFSIAALPRTVRVALENTPPNERAKQMLRTWELMAWQSGLTLAERLAIHFQRVGYADSMYFGVRQPFADSTEATISGEPVADPRREVYIRFGEPARVIHTPIVGQGSRPGVDYETWVFPDPAHRKPMLFHFTGANAKYSMVVSAGCNENWLGDRATLTPRLGQMYQACLTRSPNLAGIMANHRREQQEDYKRNLDREFAFPARPGLRFAYQLYTFADPATGANEVVAVAQIPVEEIPGSAELRAGFFLRSEQDSLHSQVLDHRMTSAGNATVTISIPGVSDGDYAYRIRMSDRRFQEGFVYGGEYSVGMPGTGDVRMSDIVIAEAGSQGSFRRRGDSLRPILGAISESQFDLYGEAYGIPAGESVDVQITISRGGALFRRGTNVSLKFTDTMDDDGYFAFRRLVQHDLEPGKYELTVTLRSATTGTAEQSTMIEIR